MYLILKEKRWIYSTYLPWVARPVAEIMIHRCPCSLPPYLDRFSPGSKTAYFSKRPYLFRHPDVDPEVSRQEILLFHNRTNHLSQVWMKNSCWIVQNEECPQNHHWLLEHSGLQRKQKLEQTMILLRIVLSLGLTVYLYVK